MRVKKFLDLHKYCNITIHIDEYEKMYRERSVKFTYEEQNKIMYILRKFGFFIETVNSSEAFVRKNEYRFFISKILDEYYLLAYKKIGDMSLREVGEAYKCDEMKGLYEKIKELNNVLF